MSRLNSEKKQKVKNICDSLGYPETSESTYPILNSLYEKQLYKGRSEKVIIASSVLTACKSEELPVTIDDVAECTNTSKNDVLNLCGIINSNIEEVSLSPVSWEVFLEYSVSELNIKEDIAEMAYEIGQHGVEEKIHSGRKPQVYAGSTLYASCSLDNRATSITQSKISKLLNIGVSTLRETYKLLIKNYKND